MIKTKHNTNTSLTKAAKRTVQQKPLHVAMRQLTKSMNAQENIIPGIIYKKLKLRRAEKAPTGARGGLAPPCWLYHLLLAQLAPTPKHVVQN